jgi:hypothetical protein
VVTGGFTIWEVVWRGMRIRVVSDHPLGRVTRLLCRPTGTVAIGRRMGILPSGVE